MTFIGLRLNGLQGCVLRSQPWGGAGRCRPGVAFANDDHPCSASNEATLSSMNEQVSHSGIFAGLEPGLVRDGRACLLFPPLWSRGSAHGGLGPSANPSQNACTFREASPAPQLIRSVGLDLRRFLPDPAQLPCGPQRSASISCRRPVMHSRAGVESIRPNAAGRRAQAS